MAMKSPEQAAQLSDRDRYLYAWNEAHNELLAAAASYNVNRHESVTRISRSIAWSRLSQAAAVRLNEPQTRFEVSGPNGGAIEVVP